LSSEYSCGGVELDTLQDVATRLRISFLAVGMITVVCLEPAFGDLIGSKYAPSNSDLLLRYLLYKLLSTKSDQFIYFRLCCIFECPDK